MQDAIEQVRAELGPAACILHSRRIRSRLDQLLGRRGILEVVAAKEAAVPSRFQKEPARPLGLIDDLPSESNRQQTASTCPSETPTFESFLSIHTNSGGHLKSSNEGISRSLTEHLQRAGFSPEDCLMLGADEEPSGSQGALSDEAMRAAWTTCCERLCQSIKTRGALKVQPRRSNTPFVAVFVGPTGVGKTTTLAKLAAHFYLQQQLRIGFITVDTYRVAAIEQLRTYASIIDAPLEVVATPAEMRQACERLADVDLILVDTGGNCPKDEQRLEELREILPAAKADEIVLVMSSVCSASAFRRAVEAYGVLGISSLVLTKLDEADGFGQIWQPMLESHLPLRYVTDGQDVPRDIAIAQAPAVTWEMLGGLPAGMEVSVPEEVRDA